MKSKLFFLSVTMAFLFLVSCEFREKEEKRVESQFSNGQLAAHFPYDLGPATVDVSGYPSKIQENYKFFLAVCSACHTSARPLNAPYVKAFDWKRFVKRMHMKMGTQGYVLEPSEEKQIVEFLVYDSKIRKIDHKAEFDAQQEELQNLFVQVSKERERLTIERTEKLPKKEPPFAGVK